ncbi:MAG: cupin domain-containing protein [Granulosicoccus sp.]|nr:cupin domain-containing protein [Granulosicoccus sp.]
MLSNQETDQKLFNGLVGYLQTYQHPDLGRFRDVINYAHFQWQPVPIATLPASDFLTASLEHTTRDNRELLQLFAQHQQYCRWEQSYKKSEGLVGDDMLAGYGFVEIAGKHGPFVSDQVRFGLGVWGPEIHYPPHRHQAEELYIVLAGEATFNIGHNAPCVFAAGESAYVQPMAVHGFDTGKLPLVVLYIWQAGDLREQSSFNHQ